MSVYNPSDLAWDCHLPLCLFKLPGIGSVIRFSFGILTCFHTWIPFFHHSQIGISANHYIPQILFASSLPKQTFWAISVSGQKILSLYPFSLIIVFLIVLNILIVNYCVAIKNNLISYNAAWEINAQWSHFPSSFTRNDKLQTYNPHAVFIFITYASQNNILYILGLKFYNLTPQSFYNFFFL